MESEYERLRKKVENFPSASAYNRLAELARLNGDSAEAENICHRCIKEFPRNGQAYVMLGEIALKANRKSDAIQQLHNAVERDPRSYAGHRQLADIYAGDKQFAKALHHLRQILVFKPNDPPVVAKLEELTKQAGSTQVDTSATRKPATGVFGAKPNFEPFAMASITPGGVPVLSAKAGAAPASRTQALQALCAEQGVRGAVITDGQGRVVLSHGDCGGQVEMLAALASEITQHASTALTKLGHDQLASWMFEAEKGQVLAFRRDAVLTLAILADTGVRAALLELRARQVLIDLGAA